jgi:hypothetical protein
MKACQWVIGIVGVLYLVALALLLTGTFGLFGQERDPLAGVFLVPLGLPWILGVDVLPEALKPWAAIFAPLLNIAILTVFCRIRQSRPDS